MRKSVEECREEARRAGQWISQDPERYGENLLNCMDYELEQFLSEIPEEMRDIYEPRFVQKFKEWMRAQSRCFSALVTGAGNFNQRQHQKRNEAERAARKRLEEWTEKTVKRLNRKERLVGMDEVERLTAQLEAFEEAQQGMKAVNAICRRKLSETEMVNLIVSEVGLSEELARELVFPNPDRGTYCKGYTRYSLSLNLAKIKDLKAKIARHEKLASKENRTVEFDRFTIEMCYTDERIRIRHAERPSREEVAMLKSNAFKWSPSNQAWQRQMTQNAMYAVWRMYSLTKEDISI
ncbi:MAG: hypothetical protein ACI4D9_05715 [Lachnospiraceae bacterium]